MSMQTPPFGDKVWPSIDVAPPYGTMGTYGHLEQSKWKGNTTYLKVRTTVQV